MFATDFLFDENRASDFGLMIGCFDGDSQTATGGNIEYTVVKTPNRDTFDFYGSQFNEVITWNFSIMKIPCMNEDEDMFFDQYEESRIAQWLLKQDGYRWFQFDQEGYEDIYYMVQINMLPHQICGRTIGFDLTVTSNCGYGFSEEIEKTYTFNNNKSIRLDIHGDTNSYILPYITIENGNGDFYISNDSDLSQCHSNAKETALNNISKTVTLDSDNDLIQGISSSSCFNWYFPRLVNGVNNITTNSTNDIKITFKYREPRRVIV